MPHIIKKSSSPPREHNDLRNKNNYLQYEYTSRVLDSSTVHQSVYAAQVVGGCNITTESSIKQHWVVTTVKKYTEFMDRNVWTIRTTHTVLYNVFNCLPQEIFHFAFFPQDQNLTGAKVFAQRPQHWWHPIL